MRAEDRIVIDFDVAGPFDLRELTAAFEGMAWHVRSAIERCGYSSGEAAKVKLYVTRIKSGSLTTEIALGAAVLGQAFQVMDYSLVVSDFVERITGLIRYFTGKEGKPPESMNAVELRELTNMIHPVARSIGGRLGIRRVRVTSREKKGDCDREVVFEMDTASAELAQAELRMGETVEELKAEERGQRNRHEHVLMYLQQASRGEGQPPGKRTGDKAVIEAVTKRPLPVHFVPGAEKLKDEMISREENPFRLGFIVDVDVETRNGKPALYVVRAIHDVVELDDEGPGDAAEPKP